MSGAKNAIYTAIFGGYDKLKEPVVVTPGWDYIAFSDEKLHSQRWKTSRFKRQAMDPARQSKFIKILGTQLLDNYERLIWVDGSLRIKCDLNKFVEKYHKPPFTVMKHPARNCIYDEAEIIIREKIDKEKTIREQLGFYEAMGFPKNYGLTANGVMIMDVGKIDGEFLRYWWDMVKKFSKRDQMSFMYAMWLHPVPYHMIPYDIIFNEFEFVRHGNG